LHRGVVDFYRGEMMLRYRTKHLRKFSEFDMLTEAKIAGMRAFFFGELYATGARRHEQDTAIESMMGLFLSPKRVAPLTPIALQSLRNLGRNAPTAIASARRTLDLYDRARALEFQIVENARQYRVRVSDTKHRDTMLWLVQTIPERDVRQVIKDVTRLFEMTANLPMMHAGLQMLEAVQDVMVRKPEKFAQHEIDAVTYAAGIARLALAQVEDFSQREIDALVAGILAVETQWYEEVMSIEYEE
jgi:hypothetical protein